MSLSNPPVVIGEALRELDTCEWLKITATHVSAARYKTRAEMRMLSRDDLNKPHAMKQCDVQIRRKKSESFEAMLIRAAGLVRAGHLPTVRVPPLTNKDRCACGATTHDLKWNDQLQQRMCPKCVQAWAVAARNNDMAPTTGGAKH